MAAVLRRWRAVACRGGVPWWRAVVACRGGVPWWRACPGRVEEEFRGRAENQTHPTITIVFVLSARAGRRLTFRADCKSAV